MSTNRTGKQARRLLGCLAGAAMLLTAQMTSAGTITGTAHDFSSNAWAGGQICVVCHAPHNTPLPAAGPLWNHALSVATYTVYASPTLDATALAQPGSVSRLCLSCHDGTVAINSFGGVTGTSFVGGSNLLGTNLSNDHPIGLTYDAALVTADGALNPITTPVTIGLGGTRSRAGTIASNMLFGGRLECASCHDVHNTFTAITNNLLKVPIAGSTLCLTCHAK